MTRLRFILVPLLLLLGSVLPQHLYAAPAKLFEGSVTFRVKTAQGTNEMKQYIKERKLRVEVLSMGKILSIGLADYAAKKMYLAYPDKGVYTELNISPTSLSAEAKKAIENSKIYETGKSTEILGFQCSQWRHVSDKSATDIWVARDFGGFLEAVGLEESDPLVEWRKEIMGSGGFPLRVVEYDSNGKELSRMDAIAVDRSSLDDETFELPEDLKKLDTAGQ